VSSRKPKDIPAFNQKMLELFGKSRDLSQPRQAARDSANHARP